MNVLSNVHDREYRKLTILQNRLVMPTDNLTQKPIKIGVFTTVIVTGQKGKNARLFGSMSKVWLPKLS